SYFIVHPRRPPRSTLFPYTRSSDLVACPHLVQIGLLVLDLAAEVPGVTREKPRPVASQLLSCRALDLAVGKATRPQQLRKRQSLNELRIEIELRRVPQPCAEEKRPSKRVTPCPVGVQ